MAGIPRDACEPAGSYILALLWFCRNIASHLPLQESWQRVSSGIQAGLVLALLGGVEKPDGASHFRGALHVLLCGSAGTPQNELLQVG